MEYTRSPLSCIELKEILWPESFDSCDDIDHAIIMCSGGLVEKRQSMKFHYVHLTAREFLLTQDACWVDGSQFLPSRMESNSQLALKCTSYITYSIACRPLSGNITRSISADEACLRFPFLNYAARYWLEHLGLAIRELSTYSTATFAENLFDAVTKLLGLPFNLMAWVEATYTLSRSLPLLALDDLEAACSAYLAKDASCNNQTQTTGDLVEFVADMRSIAKEWGETLCLQPHEIWNDVHPFTSSRFLAKNSTLTVRSLRSSSSNVDPMFKISRYCDQGNRGLIANLIIRASR
jgi:hypothetical protein